jgi:hypothetical protein
MAHLSGELSWVVKRTRTGCTPQEKQTAARQVIAVAKPRVSGKFVKLKPTTQDDGKRKRSESEEELHNQLRKQAAEHKEHIARLQSESAETLANLNKKLAEKETLIRSLRAKSHLPATEPAPIVPSLNRRLLGGKTQKTKKRLADVLQTFIDQTYDTAAQPQALLAHFERHPELYKLIIDKILGEGVTLSSFLTACDTNPEWLNPVRREVVAEIEKF